MSRISNFLQLTNECGNCPSNWLPVNLRHLKLLHFSNFGMVPWKFLFRISKFMRWSLIFPKHGGIILKWLWEKSRYLMQLRLQIKEGTSPLKLFLEIEKKTMCSGSTESGQVSLIKLSEKSTNCNDTRWLNSRIFSVIKLEYKKRDLNFWQPKILTGTFPEIRFDPRSKKYRDEQFPIVRLNFINHLVGFIPCQICLYFNN